MQMTKIGLGFRCERKPVALILRMCCKPLLLAGHLRAIPSQEIQSIQSQMKCTVITICQSMLDRLSSFVEVFRSKEENAKRIVLTTVRLNMQSSLSRFKGLGVVSFEC